MSQGAGLTHSSLLDHLGAQCVSSRGDFPYNAVRIQRLWMRRYVFSASVGLARGVGDCADCSDLRFPAVAREHRTVRWCRQAHPFCDLRCPLYPGLAGFSGKGLALASTYRLADFRRIDRDSAVTNRRSVYGWSGYVGQCWWLWFWQSSAFILLSALASLMDAASSPGIKA